MHLRKRTAIRRGCLIMAMAIAMSSVAGCGGTCDVQGRVTYQGKPVVFGGVVVLDDQDKSVSARIDPDGNYIVTGVKTGTLRFAIVSPNPAGVTPKSSKPETKNSQEPGPGARATPAAPTGAAAPKSDLKWQPLPKQYEDPGTSGITTTAQRGANTFDIELK